MGKQLTPEEATRLVMSPDGPPHAEVVAQLPSDVAWNAGERRFEKVRLAPDVTPSDLAAAGLTEPVEPAKPRP